MTIQLIKAAQAVIDEWDDGKSTWVDVPISAQAIGALRIEVRKYDSRVRDIEIALSGTDEEIQQRRKEIQREENADAEKSGP